MKILCKTLFVTLALILASIALGGCGQIEPTEEPTMAAPPPTQIAVQPTVTASATAAPTPSPLPTATEVPPTPTPEGHAPQIVDLEDQSISDMERFPRFDLDDHVRDADHDADRIEWQISGNEELELRLIGSNLFVSLPQVEWTGSETLRFEACDPDGLCDAREVTFTVRAENDAPAIGPIGQIVTPGETFDQIILDEVTHDEDNTNEELTWSVSGNVDLGVTIDDGVFEIELPDAEWRGKETLHFEACDPYGACGSRDATFWVMERSDARIEVTYIGNAGFMVVVGDKKILIDSLFEGFPGGYVPPREIVESLAAAEPPFDDVDLILATHSHADHFGAEMVYSHLENNPEAVFVSARDAVNMVNTMGNVGERAVPIDLRAGEHTHLVVNDIGLEAKYLSHGGEIANLGFIITVDGRRIFHSGDIDPETESVSKLEDYGLPERQIDVAFVAHFMLSLEEYHAHITRGIQARYNVAMHYAYTAPPPDYEAMERYFPEAIVFHEEMEHWSIGTETPMPSAAAAPSTATNGEGRVEITIVYDNTAYQPGLRTDWGFGAWIEYGQHTILFDTGTFGYILLGNMAELGLDPQAIDIIVLSHIHEDHTGGLSEVLDTGIEPVVYVPASFPEPFKNEIRARTELVEVNEAVEIVPGVHSTGQLGGDLVEQGLAIETTEGLVVITGCAHPGIVKMVDAARSVVGGEIALVTGGFHLSQFGDHEVEHIIDRFQEYGVQKVCPTHCTGDRAISLFASAYGEDYVKGGVGQVIAVGSRVSSAAPQASGDPDETMELIPAGPFVMGSEDGEADAPPHTETLPAYYIDRYEVTNAQFAALLNEQGNQREGGRPWLDANSPEGHLEQVEGVWQPKEGYADHPVVEVTWYGAQAYCLWRGARLPTEAEWEKAARGTDERTYPWGEEIDCDHANYGSCSTGESVPVGNYPDGASPYGVYDLAGNVAEWTADWYAADYYLNSPAENPPGPESSPSMRKVSRGGSWYSNSIYLRAFHRNHEFTAISSFGNVGFRCALSP